MSSFFVGRHTPGRSWRRCTYFMYEVLPGPICRLARTWRDSGLAANFTTGHMAGMRASPGSGHPWLLYRVSARRWPLSPAAASCLAAQAWASCAGGDCARRVWMYVRSLANMVAFWRGKRRGVVARGDLYLTRRVKFYINCSRGGMQVYRP